LDCNTCYHTKGSKGDDVLINAKEARRIVEQGYNEKAIAQLEQIEWELENAIQNGKFNVSLDGVIEASNRRKLESLGYKVSAGSQYNESYFTISW
jgi:hypothetical protein